MSDPYNRPDNWSFGVAAAPKPSSPSRRPLIAAVLLLIIVIICFLLFQKDLAFPGLYFWFIGGDLMQFWAIVLIILGLVYWRMLPRAPKTNSTRRFAPNSNAFMNDPNNFGGFSAQQSPRSPASLLFRLPLVLLLAFLIFYFFIQGYTFRLTPHPTVMGDCNAGSITIVGNSTADTVSLKAGLTTIEGYGNYDQSSNILNINGNLCGFTISVPAHSNLQVTGNDAEITVTGVQGKFDLENNAGDITVNQSCLQDGSIVDNNAGTINISNSVLSPSAQVTSNDSPINKVSNTTSETCPG
jgi:hypothetical protein